MNKLFIPKRINVGFQEREGTYTGKLAYVIYWDDKNKLRKEASWNSWRDNKIKPQDFDNVPTEGFVLNKKVGGYKSDWNFRQTYCRVYDPRGFEFEINIPNLLFILQECNAYKGKGLEGEFVYAWDGTDLALLPAHCKEYQDSIKFTELQSKKIGTKDLIPGCYYKTKKDDKELMYLGNFNYVEQHYKGSGAIEKKHVFYNSEGTDSYWRPMFVGMTSLSTLAVRVNDTAVPEFAEKLEEFSKSKWSGNITELTTKKDVIKLPKDKINDGYYSYGGYDYFWGNKYYYDEKDVSLKKRVCTTCVDEGNGIFRVCTITAHREIKKPRNSTSSYYREEEFNHWYTLSSSKVMYLENGELITKSRKFTDDTKYTGSEIKAMDFVKVEYSLAGNKTKKEVLA